MSERSARAQPVERIAPADGTAFWFTTDLYVVKLASEDTGGAFTLSETTVAPQSPPLAHMHHKEDEIYYVLDGEFEFMDGDRAFTAGAGSLVFLRKDRFPTTGTRETDPPAHSCFTSPVGSRSSSPRLANQPKTRRHCRRVSTRKTSNASSSPLRGTGSKRRPSLGSANRSANDT